MVNQASWWLIMGRTAKITPRVCQQSWIVALEWRGEPSKPCLMGGKIECKHSMSNLAAATHYHNCWYYLGYFSRFNSHKSAPKLLPWCSAQLRNAVEVRNVPMTMNELTHQTWNIFFQHIISNTLVISWPCLLTCDSQNGSWAFISFYLLNCS